MERNNLIEYLPPYMVKFKEMQQIMSTEDKELDKIDTAVQSVLNNAFIKDCDENGIKVYEKLLKITPNRSESLESRKARVSLRWNDRIPYTLKTLLNRINGLCGVNNYDLDADWENYYFQLTVHLELFSEVKTLETILDEMLPLNISYDVSNVIECKPYGNVYTAGTVTSTEIIQVGGVS